jgi:glycosyltransferase involved in cell wall biosynthesis
MILSLLMLTLESRRHLFNQLFGELSRQIRESEWAGDVEILVDCDGGEKPIGEKRNSLIQRAQGTFVAFIDDDDGVSGDYVRRICEAITRRPGVDCIGIKGLITFNGSHPREFIHSLRYSDYSSRNHTYYRPPYHLNPIRRDIAVRYQYLGSGWTEDQDWALRVQADGALRTEEYIDSVLYYYHCRRAWTYQWLLDVTEGFRHRFGIRFVNMMPVQKLVNSFINKKTVN